MARRQDILGEIVAHKAAELEARQRELPLSQLEWALGVQQPVRNFAAALRTPGVSLIAEIKRASPSRGLLKPSLDAPAVARVYEQGGAAAVSVLTEERYFRGSLIDLASVRLGTGIPILRKDFLLTPYQIIEARAWGADAVLLIAAILDESQLKEMRELAESLGMSALVEVHDEHELACALNASATLIGVNNRDLRTFQTDLETTHRLRPLVPSHCLLVSESGVHSRPDVERLREWGVDAMLVGETLVQSDDLPGKLAEMIG